MRHLRRLFTGYPLPAWLGLALLSYGGYYGGRWVRPAALHLALTSLSGLLYAICILLSPFFIYLASYLQGCTQRRRLLCAGTIPFLWMTKDVLVISASHPLIESLYWYLNPMYIFYICLVCIEIGLATLAGRWALRRQGAEARVWSAAPLVLIIAPMILMAAIYSWGQGENLHALYLEGYRQIFGRR